LSAYERALRKEDRDYFHQMLEECKKYTYATNSRERLLPTEPMIIVLTLIQYKMIRKLLAIVETEREYI
jgi:hypothetical protein